MREKDELLILKERREKVEEGWKERILMMVLMMIKQNTQEGHEKGKKFERGKG